MGPLGRVERIVAAVTGFESQGELVDGLVKLTRQTEAVVWWEFIDMRLSAAHAATYLMLSRDGLARDDLMANVIKQLEMKPAEFDAAIRSYGDRSAEDLMDDAVLDRVSSEIGVIFARRLGTEDDSVRNVAAAYWGEGFYASGVAFG